MMSESSKHWILAFGVYLGFGVFSGSDAEHLIYSSEKTHETDVSNKKPFQHKNVQFK